MSSDALEPHAPDASAHARLSKSVGVAQLLVLVLLFAVSLLLPVLLAFSGAFGSGAGAWLVAFLLVVAGVVLGNACVAVSFGMLRRVEEKFAAGHPLPGLLKTSLPAVVLVVGVTLLLLLGGNAAAAALLS